jgi:hypothetical protein
MLTEIIAVSAMSHKQNVDTRCGHNAGVSNVKIEQVVHTQPLFSMNWLHCWFSLGYETACGQGLVPRLESQPFRQMEKGKLCLIYGVQILGKKSVKQCEKNKWEISELPMNLRWDINTENFINPRKHQVLVYRQEFIISSVCHLTNK